MPAPTEIQTHVIFVENDENHPDPLFYQDLGAANTAAEDIIKNNIHAKCYVFQQRTLLTGKVEVVRKDFSSATQK